MSKPTITCLIPARMSSSRFPGKPLAPINGFPMIGHVYRQALKWKRFDRIFVVTPDRDIHGWCRDNGYHSIITPSTNNDCLDCAALGLHEIAKIYPDTDRYVILQGDEPLFDCSVLDNIDFTPEVSNLYTSLPSCHNETVTDVNIVKVLITRHHRAIYFSRANLPHLNGGTMRRYHIAPLQKQLGVYIFSGKMLFAFHYFKPTVLEDHEGIGMNRLIEYGIPIQMQYSPHDSISVDIPSDIQKVETILNMETK